MKRLLLSFFLFISLSSTSLCYNFLNDIFFVNEEVGWIISYQGYIYKTTDGGLTWKFLTTSPQEGLFKIYFISPDTGFVLCSGSIYKSVDGGSSWEKMDFNTASISGIYFINTTLGFVSGRGVNSLPSIWKTENGSKTWREVNVELDSMDYIYPAEIADFSFVEQNIGYASSSTTIFKTTDSGESWQRLPVFFYSPIYYLKLNKVEALNADTVIMQYNGETVFVTGFLSVTYDGGMTWPNYTLKYFYFGIIDIHFKSLDTGWVSSQSLSYKTVDQGKTWDALDIRLGAFWFINDSVSVGIGEVPDNDKIFRTTDGWKTYSLIDSTITSVSEISNSPSEYLLHQNYPNPFNPVTTIEYQIPRSEFVKIKVYDILGREVATLVNEQKPPGTYEVVFSAGSFGDAQNLSPKGSTLTSGVYFYTLRAGGFMETKKMVLLR